MSRLISTLWIILELFFYQQFWSLFFQRKQPHKKYWLSFSLATAISVFASFLELPQPVYTITYLISFVVLSSYLFAGSFLQHSIIVLIGVCIMSAFDTVMIYGTSWLLGISVSQLIFKKALYTILCSFERLFLILIGYLLNKVRKLRSIHSIQAKYLLLSALFPCLAFLMLMVIFGMCQQNADLSAGAVAFSFVLAIVCVTTIYLLNQMEKSEQVAKSLSLLNQERELQAEHILALEKSYRAQRKITHDFRNQLQTIFDLLAMDHSDKAMAYIQELQGMQTTRLFLTNSGNTIIDAILNHKSQIAHERDIDVQIHINNLANVAIETDMLIVLLSNLLDNAIEGCCRIADARQIILELVLKDDTLWLSIKNTSAPVLFDGNTIPTSKEPKEDHGYGIPRIQYILNLLHAEYVFDFCDGWFTFASEIPLSS